MTEFLVVVMNLESSVIQTQRVVDEDIHGIKIEEAIDKFVEPVHGKLIWAVYNTKAVGFSEEKSLRDFAEYAKQRA